MFKVNLFPYCNLSKHDVVCEWGAMAFGNNIMMNSEFSCLVVQKIAINPDIHTVQID